MSLGFSSNQYQQGGSGSGVQNGGMFSRQKIQQLTRQVMNIYSGGTGSRIEPPSVARCMIDTYRGMNKHFIPTGVFDKDKKGYISEEDVLATANRIFLMNNSGNSTTGGGMGGNLRSAFR